MVDGRVPGRRASGSQQARKTTGEPGGVAPQRQHDALPADSPCRKPTQPRLAFAGSDIDDGQIARGKGSVS
jgi:hypothetical protein